MRLMQLAFLNFKNNMKNYLSLVLSLSFTILIFLNFQNIIYSDSFEVLGAQNKDYIDIIVHVISFVLACFMFFFLWYSTNVFLTKRKKEIGIYVFMGLTNQKIGKMYMIETALIGMAAFVLGIFFGIATAALFQMILLAISDIAVEIHFQVRIEPVLITAAVYLAMYLIFVVKGYCNIVKSSVLSMISASRQNEYVRQSTPVLMFKAALGTCILGGGYYLSVKEGGQEVMGNVMAAVVLVTAGVYLLFGGLIPYVFQSVAKSKRILYRGQRNLWVNSMIFRMKKNYRTYAIVCVLTLCSVTALATGFAMKIRHANMVQFENTYTFQFLSNQSDIGDQAAPLIEKYSGILYRSEIPVLFLDNVHVSNRSFAASYAVVPYSGVKRLAEQAGMVFELREPGADEVIEAGHLYLLSLLTDRSDITVTINGKDYRQIQETSEPYLGYLQEQTSYYIVNDAEYELLKPFGQSLYTSNFKITDTDLFEAARDELNALICNTEENFTARVAIDPKSNDTDWVKVLYTLCIFLFLVFIMASGSIMFMKLYNDSFEERPRALVMKKIGIDNKTLGKSIAAELGMAYILPFAVMTVSSYFSVHALEKMMHTSLFSIRIVSVLIVFAIFFFFYLISVAAYRKNVC